ncbi:PrgI family protein [Longispora albida]|uniref:PrgI family protein n=1 Tax=Longispora albida TaxID=203523 RepID=UPI000374CB5C|nr:PrgI family protein [Longispora albida]
MNTDDTPVRAKIPADIDAPDKILYGLTFRQMAILAAAATIVYLGWQALHTVVPMPVLLAAAVLIGGVTFGLAVGRRDGLPLDVWLLSAVRQSRAPRSLAAGVADAGPVPEWVDAGAARVALPAPLRLPADAIGDDGQIQLGASSRAIVAATSLNLGLRSNAEQAAAVDAFGRWLNSLNAAVQITVSAQPVDLASHADALAEHAAELPHPALAAACADHAEYLAELAARRDPLRRQVLITCDAGSDGGEHAARRRAEDAARALAALGVTTRVLDGASATAALASAADPYRPPRNGGLAAPGQTITAPTDPSRTTS